MMQVRRVYSAVCAHDAGGSNHADYSAVSKYSEMVWLPIGRIAPTSANANRLTGLPNTYSCHGKVGWVGKVAAMAVNGHDNVVTNGVIRSYLAVSSSLY